MPEITEKELKKQIDKSELSNLYFLYGEEKYMISYYERKIEIKAGAVNFPDFNFQKFNDSASIDEIAAAVEALPFMAETKYVIVSDFNAETLRANETAKLEELLENIPGTTIIVFYLPFTDINFKKDKKWKKFISLVNKLGLTVDFKKRSNIELEKILCSKALKLGCELSRKNAGLIVKYCGNDLQTLMNEVEKLCAFIGQGEITSDTIDNIVVKNLETRVYDLSKAILSSNYDKAYRVLDLLFYQNEEPVSILAVLSSAYIDMYRVRISIQSGYSAMEPAKYFNYARKEFRLTNAERDSKRFSVPMLHQSLEVLLKADTALKSSRGDRRIIMEKLIAQLLLIAEKEKIA